MFIARSKVRMHDTDTAGVIFFARLFHFAHDALEDFAASEGLSFDRVFHAENFVFVIVHAEGDYHAPLKVGDAIETHVSVENVGETSFTIGYKIYKEDGILAGSVKTVHVTLDGRTRKKISIPDFLRKILVKSHND